MSKNDHFWPEVVEAFANIPPELRRETAVKPPKIRRNSAKRYVVVCNKCLHAWHATKPEPDRCPKCWTRRPNSAQIVRTLVECSDCHHAWLWNKKAKGRRCPKCQNKNVQALGNVTVV